MRELYLVTLMILVGAAAGGQSLTVRRADRQYVNLHYANAAELYVQAIGHGEGDDNLYLKIADCYYKVKNSKDAEKYYRMVAGKMDEDMLFQYTQSLLQNGKYNEAKTLLESNNVSKQKLINIREADIPTLLDKSPSKAVYLLDFNSPYADFSPAVFQKGIVFASARKKGGLHKNVFGWSNTPFLNLYYLDTAGIGKSIFDRKISKEQFQANVSKNSIYSYDEKLHDDETIQTSNDANTLGYFGKYFSAKDSMHSNRMISTFSRKFNKKFHDGPVAFSPDQKTALLTRNRRNQKSSNGVDKLKLYALSSQNGVWSKPEALPINNNEYSVGHASFDPSGKIVYFVSDMPGGKGGTDIYSMSYNNGQWGKPENIESVNTDASEMFPYITQNGYLMFASDGWGGLGGLDVMATDLKGHVKNLGFPLNSNKDDFGITADPSVVKGFVSSNRRRNGLDDDIYFYELNEPLKFAQRLRILVLDRNTSRPVTDADVTATGGLPALRTDKQGVVAYEVEAGKPYSFIGRKTDYTDGLASITIDKNASDNQLKIFMDNKSSLFLLISDRVSNVPLANVHVKINDVNTKSQFLQDSTSSAGDLRKDLQAKPGDKLMYTIQLDKPGYLSKTVSFNYQITKPGEIPVHEFLDLKLDKVAIGMDVGKVININPIYFDLNKATIREDASLELDKIVQVMKDNPSMIIELGSHTDCRSSATYNLNLSNRRANASAQYVVSRGIDKSRIYGRGYGESKLVNNCACEGNVKPTCPEEEHQLNRRTEFVIIKM